MDTKIILTLDENLEVTGINLEGAPLTSKKDPCSIHPEKRPCREHQIAAKNIRLVKTKTNPTCYWVWDGKKWSYVCV